jgi:four helix bundle protein
MTAPPPPVLADRLVEFAVRIGAAVQSMPRDFVGENIGRQLVRCGTSPAANHAEARDSVSGKDYVFRMQVCLKELRETMVWLRVAQGNGLRNVDYGSLQRECNELTTIVVTCVKKAKARL